MKTKWKITPYLYILPVILISGVILYYSIGFTVFTSFQDWNGLSNDMEFTGLENYKDVLADETFYVSLRNTLIFMVVTVFVQAAIGLLLAVLLRAKLKGNTFFKALFFMPVVMAPIILAAIFRIILDTNVGTLNELLRAINLDFLAVSWLGDPKFALISIIGVNIFQWMGFSMLLYYSSLGSIPDEVYEAAKMDGAGFWRTLFKITIPMLKGTTTTLIVLGIVGSLKTFDIVVLLTGGGPGISTEFLATYLYSRLFEQFNGGMASAIGVIILIIAIILSIAQIKLHQKSVN